MKRKHEETTTEAEKKSRTSNLRTVAINDPADFEIKMTEYVALAKEEKRTLFLCVTGSKNATTGLSWCSDCTRAEPVINEALEAFPSLLVEAPVERNSYKGISVPVCEGDICHKQVPQVHPYRTHPKLMLKSIPSLYSWDLSAHNSTGSLGESECGNVTTVTDFVTAAAGGQSGTSASGSCCPADSLPEAAAAEAKGEEITVGNMKIWKVGTAVNGRVIIAAYDIFGMDSGRSKQVCEEIASYGYMVLMPDYFRQDPEEKDIMGKIKRNAKWGPLEADFMATLDYALSHGGKMGHIGVIGFCWGTWITVKASAISGIAAGIQCHPSHPKVAGMAGEDEAEVLEAIQCPQLIMSSGSEGPSTRPGGLADTILSKKPFANNNKFREFDSMKHGWVSRGDLSDPAVKTEYENAMQEIKLFFQAHL